MAGLRGGSLGRDLGTKSSDSPDHQRRRRSEGEDVAGIRPRLGYRPICRSGRADLKIANRVGGEASASARPRSAVLLGGSTASANAPTNACYGDNGEVTALDRRPKTVSTEARPPIRSARRSSNWSATPTSVASSRAFSKRVIAASHHRVWPGPIIGAGQAALSGRRPRYGWHAVRLRRPMAYRPKGDPRASRFRASTQAAAPGLAPALAPLEVPSPADILEHSR